MAKGYSARKGFSGGAGMMQQQAQMQYARHYAERILCSDPDTELRTLATELADDKYTLSKVYTKFQKIETEEDRLVELIPRTLSELKNAILSCNLADARERLRTATESGGDIAPILAEIARLNVLKGCFAHVLGDRIITPGHP